MIYFKKVAAAKATQSPLTVSSVGNKQTHTPEGVCCWFLLYGSQRKWWRNQTLQSGKKRMRKNKKRRRWHLEANECWSRILHPWQVLNQIREKQWNGCVGINTWHPIAFCLLPGHIPETVKLLGWLWDVEKVQHWTLEYIIWGPGWAYQK